MNRFLVLVLAAVIVLVSGVPAQDKALQKRINEAIEKGVKHLREIQKEDGTWPYAQPHPDIGATALAGLALLESGVSKNDPAIQKAARAVRAETPMMNNTYRVSLAIMFLDRLGDPLDIPIVEMLGVSLLAHGQTGGWHYSAFCMDEEFLGAYVKQRELGRVKPVKKATKPKELPRQVQLALAKIEPLPKDTEPDLGDNSNTQFAVLALWIARRYGLPVDSTLAMVDKRYRAIQHSNGGWGYRVSEPRSGEAGYAAKPAMTCSGLVGLAVYHGTRKDATKRAILGDPAVKKALEHLEEFVGKSDPNNALPQGGNGYYYLWTLERMAMLYGLKKIGEQDWYVWGSELLVAAQGPDGAWEGSYQSCVDTSFALLFLRRSNIAPDLTILLQGIAKDSATPSPIGKTTSTVTPEPVAKVDLSIAQARAEAVRLSSALVDAAEGERDSILEKIRQGKGAPFNQALAATIPQLKGDSQDKARKTLVDRLAAQPSGEVRKELKAIDVELRRAAAKACASLKAKEAVPDLVELLVDAESAVAQAAHQALREITAQDFGPAAGARREERDKAVRAWREWWKSQ